jgi:tetratricopeptide (TPR) repeat protein
MARTFITAACLVLIAGQGAWAKKVLVFDEKQGIIWVEEGAQKQAKESFEAPTIKKTEVVTEEQTVTVRKHVSLKPASAEDYISTGMKFYYGRDFGEALKYFEKAWESQKLASYYFLVGATMGKLDSSGAMVRIFNEIRQEYPKDSAADDATFYLAVYYQSCNEYQAANELYKDVVELYPEGTSIIGSLVFREEAKKQLRAMKIDLLSRLKLLDYKDNNALELLKQFQRDNGLEETGRPDRATVELLISKSDAREEKLKTRIEGGEGAVSGRTIWYILIDFLLLSNLLWGLRNLKIAADAFRRIELLERVTE